MHFDQTPEFQKDLKRLSKKWRSLPLDIEDAQLIISDVYTEGDHHELVQQKFFDGKRAAKITVKNDIEVVKMRLDVATLGTNNKVRVIFVAAITKRQVTFIELFAKNDKDREDISRIRRYLG